jgi:hypothetical protein
MKSVCMSETSLLDLQRNRNYLIIPKQTSRFNIANTLFPDLVYSSSHHPKQFAKDYVLILSSYFILGYPRGCLVKDFHSEALY